MKKLLSFLLALVMLFTVVTALSACNDESSSRKSRDNSRRTTTTTKHESGNNIVIKNEINSLDDLDGRIVAVQVATTSHDIVNGLVENGLDIDIMPYEKITQCFDDLQVGRADAVLADSVVAAYYLMGNNADRFEITWTSEDGEPMGICFSKNSAELAELVEAAIDTLYYNGTMSELAVRHFGNDFTAGLRTVRKAPVIDRARAQALTGGVLKVGLEVGYPPMEYLASDGKTYIGFDIDVAYAIGELLGVEVEFVNTAWDGIFAGLDKGEYDCIISAVSITPERQDKYILTEPYVSNKQQIIVAK